MNEGCCTVHAEVDALLQVANRENIQGSTVYVVRVTKLGVLGDSEPCAMCSEILQEHGVKKVFFTVSPNENVHGEMIFR